VTADELEDEFQAKVVQYSYGLLLLPPDDAVALIRRAAESRIGILGIDGMLIGPGETVSPIEHIIDFSTAHSRGDGCWAEAEDFIGQRSEPGLVFEVVLGRRLDRSV
jgi:hypothetical protein